MALAWDQATVLDEGKSLTPEELLTRGRKASILERVDELLQTEEFFASQTPVHVNPNGFSRFELAGRGRRWPQVRLHLWHGSKNRDIHEHPWAGLSFVLRGRVDNTLFQIAEGATHQMLVHWTQRAGEFQLFDAGWCTCKTLNTTNILTGQQYGFVPGEFHDTDTSPGTITVLLRSAYLREFSRVARLCGGQAE